MKRTASFEIAEELLDEFGEFGDVFNFDQKVINFRHEVIQAKEIRSNTKHNTKLKTLDLKLKVSPPVASQISKSFLDFMSSKNDSWREIILDMNKVIIHINIYPQNDTHDYGMVIIDVRCE
jgi:hypothetical protein